MTVQLDTRPAADTTPTPSVWDQPDRLGVLNQTAGPNEVGTVTAADVRADAQRGNATQIDGSATNTGTREQTTSATGQPLFVDKLGNTKNVEITRERTAELDQGQYYVQADQLVFKTGNTDDQIKVTPGTNGNLSFDVNGEQYDVKLAQGQQLTIRSGDGNDTIDIDPSVKVNLIVEAGAGEDTINGGGGNSRIDGGDGDDTIKTGDGFNYVFGGSGDDSITAGSGSNTLYGGDGTDTITGGAGNDYIEGGKGNDVIAAGGGKNVLSGGLGDDSLAAGANDRVYTGAGTNTVSGLGSGGVVYAAGVGDKITGNGSGDPNVVNVVLNSDAGLKGVKVEGSDAFVQRVEADIEMLRASPNGEKMLAEFDKAAAKGNVVTIRELQNVDNGYAQSVPGSTMSTSGRPGTSGPVDISYNPSFAIPELPVPSVTLYHEMSHAFNGVNGTFLPGTYNGSGPDKGQVPNAERQAVGLDTTAKPYDFGDGSGPITHNPAALTENGLRTEMGLELRPSYVI
jgi:hypothetical protein